LIAGAGPCEASLKETAARLSINRNIRFLGRLTEPRRVYVASDLIVLPSIHETFGLVVAESFFCGTPVFRSDSAGWSIQIVIGETGDVFSSESKDQFNCKLLRLIEDKQALSRMAQHVRSFALNRFSLKEYSARMVMLYRECLAERAVKFPRKQS
jgi:glycosyltransferase involved in cell wall biosynthesis